MGRQRVRRVVEGGRVGTPADPSTCPGETLQAAVSGGGAVLPVPVPAFPAHTLQVLQPLLHPASATALDEDAHGITHSAWDSIRGHHPNTYSFT